MSYNKVIAMGRLTRDVEAVKAGEFIVYKFGLAMDSGFGDNKRTCFIEMEAWGNRGEAIAKYFKKGDGIHVDGQLELDTWTDSRSLEKKSRHKIRVENFSFPPGPKPDWEKVTQNVFPNSEVVNEE